MCNASGQCVAPDSLPCAPYICNGSKCFTRVHRQTRSAWRPTSARTTRAGASPTARRARRGRVPERVLRAGRLLRQGLHRACRSCALSGTLGVCTNIATGTVDPAGTLRGPGRRQLRHERQVPGRRVPAVRLGDAVPGRDLPDDDGQFTGLSTCNGAGACVTPGCELVLPVPVRHQRLQVSACTLDADCRRPRLHQRHVWPQAAGRDLLRRPRSA